MKHLTPNILDAFADDELSKNERLKALDHLAVCTNCQEQIASITRIQKAYSRFGPSENSPEFTRLVIRELSASNEFKPNKYKLFDQFSFEPLFQGFSLAVSVILLSLTPDQSSVDETQIQDSAILVEASEEEIFYELEDGKLFNEFPLNDLDETGGDNK